MATAVAPPGLIDSDILIDARNGVVDAISFLAAQHAGAGVRVSIISCMELAVGSRNARDMAAILQFLRQVMVSHVTAPISDRAFAFIQTYCLSHGLQIADALIAATALEEGLTLFTRNVRHFQMITGLTVVKPY
jgi:predicted nucleic acid-binding protein